MPSGVYRIEIGPNFYYGSTKDLSGRMRTHKRTLRLGTHHNVRMQNSWDKYQKFSFETIVECSPADLIALEQGFLTEFFGQSRCLNLCGTAGSPRGYKHSPEAKAKISQAAKGRKHSQEAKDKIRAGHLGLTHSAEAISKMSKPKSPEHAAKCRDNGRTGGRRKTTMG